MTLDPIKFRELVEAWEDAMRTAEGHRTLKEEGAIYMMTDFLLSHASELLTVVEADGWRPIDQHTPKGIWLECRRPSMTHPSGYWIAMLIYSDGHWLDTSGAAFEPHEYRLPPPEPAQ